MEGPCIYEIKEIGETPVLYHDGNLPTYAIADVPAVWSGKTEPPAIGAKVRINFNQLGSGVVESYFTEHGWLGVKVRLDKQPEWHRKQNGADRNFALVFGIELDYGENIDEVWRDQERR